MGIKKDGVILRSLLSFAAIARSGKIKETAAKNGMKQSNLSKIITDLEKDLGVKLFNRIHNGVSLTENGKNFFQIACGIEKILNDVRHYNTASNSVAGDIRLWTSEGIGSSYISSFLAEFYQKYPEVTLNITCSLENPNIFDQMDMGILYQEPDFPDAVILYEHVLRFKLYASKEYLSRYGSPQNMEDLLENHRICTRDNFKLWPQWNEMIEKAKHIVANTNSSTMLYSMVKNSVGISMIPTCAAYNDADMMQISRIDLCIDHPFWIVAHKDTKDIPKIRALVNYIIDATRNL